MSSDYDHSPQRLLDARREKREAEKQVLSLIEPLVDVLAKLRDWESLGFTDTLPGGGFTRPNAPNQIDLNSMPFLRPVSEAIQRYHKSLDSIRGARAALTSDQLQDLGPDQD